MQTQSGKAIGRGRLVLIMVAGALAAGADGVFLARNLFQATYPGSLMAAVRSMVHEGQDADGALARLGS